MSRRGNDSLTLVGRRDCHLCEVMAAELRMLGGDHLRFAECDVDEHPDLLAAYDLRVPVLLDGDQVLCEGRLDRTRVQAWLAADG